MNNTKQEAVAALNELHCTIPYDAYCTIHDGLTDIETLRDRDAELEELWERFSDIPMNPETECIEEPFMGWGVGIHREEIWHWFDKRHSKGIAYLLYGETADSKPESEKCFVVVHRNYADGSDAYACKSEEDARKSVKEDVESVKKELVEKGYEPVELWDALGNPEVYVSNRDIYYEWQIVETRIF